MDLNIYVYCKPLTFGNLKSACVSHLTLFHISLFVSCMALTNVAQKVPTLFLKEYKDIW